MKKTMILGAAALAATMAMGVESSVVGYLKHGDGSTVNIGAVFTPTTANGKWTFDTKVFNSDATLGDTVSILNFEIFDLDGYQFLGFDATTGESKGWSYMTSDPDTGDLVQQDIQSFELGKGAVAYCEPADAVSSFTTAGKVEDTTQSVEVTFPAETSEIVNPFPKDTTLADLETFCQVGDTLSVLNFDIFDLDGYQFLGFDATTGESKGWSYMTSDPDTGDLIQQDIKDSSRVVIPAGQGGYFEPTSPRTWTITL